MHSHVELMSFGQARDHRGLLVFIEEGTGCPFAIEQVDWGTQEDHGQGRETILFALVGEVKVHVQCPEEDAHEFLLNQSHQGIYLPPSASYWFKVCSEQSVTMRIFGAK